MLQQYKNTLPIIHTYRNGTPLWKANRVLSWQTKINLSESHQFLLFSYLIASSTKPILPDTEVLLQYFWLGLMSYQSYFSTTQESKRDAAVHLQGRERGKRWVLQGMGKDDSSDSLHHEKGKPQFQNIYELNFTLKHSPLSLPAPPTHLVDYTRT